MHTKFAYFLEMLIMDFCNQYALSDALYGKIQMFLHN